MRQCTANAPPYAHLNTKYTYYIYRMRILIVNTSERTGGAAVAAGRLVSALNNSGVQARMLVRDKQTTNPVVVTLPKGVRSRWRFFWERWTIFWHLHFNRHNLFAIDVANTGADITSLPEFKQADVIHLSWINQGMLSLSCIRKIVNSGKPVVWTMHDIWPATAICHLTLGCNNFKQQCRRCKYLPGGGGDNDLSAKVWNKKKRIYEKSDIHFVACSRWLADQARQSQLLRGHHVFAIPNPIDTHVFTPKSKVESAERMNLPTNKRLILFAAQRATNVNKGLAYLVEACRLLAAQYPDMKDNTALVVLGGKANQAVAELPFPTIPIDYVSDTPTLVSLYNAVHTFVLPSLSENLPNTIMEAMACGVPCVGFHVGGIPEEIDHKKNGYVARYRDAADLAQGIRWVLCEADYAELSAQAVRKVLANYSQQAVALQYIEVYNQALAFKKCML